MGASASVDAITKEHILGVNDVKQVLETLQIDSNSHLSLRFIYPGLRMQNSGVNRHELLSILADRYEQDVFILFLKYCCGELTSEEFLEFCRHFKLLSRREFSANKALELFNSKSYQSGPECEAKINYRVFRFDILPEIASGKGRSVREMVSKICWAAIHVPSDTSGANTTSSNKEKDIPRCDDNETIQRRIAAVRIQSSFRRLLAGRRVEEELEIDHLLSCPSPSAPKRETVLSSTDNKNPFVQKISLLKSDRICKNYSPGASPGQRKRPEHPTSRADMPEPTVEVDLEPLKGRCIEIFDSFCSTPHEMTSHDFLRLCYDTSLIPFDSVKVDFTAMQARHIFRRVIAEHFDPHRNVYDEGVVLGKRISFDIFWRVVVPEVAAVKGQRSHDIVTHMNHSSGIKRMYTNEQEGPRVISLLSNREYMNSRCDSFEGVEYDITQLPTVNILQNI